MLASIFVTTKSNFTKKKKKNNKIQLGSPLDYEIINKSSEGTKISNPRDI